MSLESPPPFLLLIRVANCNSKFGEKKFANLNIEEINISNFYHSKLFPKIDILTFFRIPLAKITVDNFKTEVLKKLEFSSILKLFFSKLRNL